MKKKVFVSIICAFLMILVFTGCGLKMPENTGSSPSTSDSSSPDADVSGSTTVIGIVSAADGDGITLNLVEQADSGATDVAGALRVGSSVYLIAGGTRTITPGEGTAVIFANEGYISGLPGDIQKGEFLAVVLRGDTVLAIIDAGLTYAAGDTDGVQPSVEPTEEPVEEPTDNGEASSPSPSAGVPDSSVTTVYTVTTDSLKVRSGPGTDSKSLGVLDTGARVKGTVTDGWLKFSYEGKTAYCKAEYLTVSTAPEGVPDSSQSKAYTTADNVLARNGPGTTYTIMGTLEKGTKVTGTVSNGWLKFTYNEKTAYCSAAYLTAG